MHTMCIYSTICATWNLNVGARSPILDNKLCPVPCEYPYFPARALLKYGRINGDPVFYMTDGSPEAFCPFTQCQGCSRPNCTPRDHRMCFDSLGDGRDDGRYDDGLNSEDSVDEDREERGSNEPEDDKEDSFLDEDVTPDSERDENENDVIDDGNDDNGADNSNGDDPQGDGHPAYSVGYHYGNIAPEITNRAPNSGAMIRGVNGWQRIVPTFHSTPNAIASSSGTKRKRATSSPSRLVHGNATIPHVHSDPPIE